MTDNRKRPIDVFISHSSDDGEFAKRLCETIEANGFRCWISSRDITAGMDWSTSITRAIEDSAVLLVVYSRNSSQSMQVPKEITLAENKGTYIIPYKIDDMPLTEYYEYHLANSHWIQFDAAAGDMKMSELCAAVSSVTQKTYAAKVVEGTPPALKTEKSAPKKGMPRGVLALIVAAVVLIAAGVAVAALLGGSDSSRDEDESGYSEEYERDETENERPSGDKDKPSEVISVPEDVQPYESGNVTLLDNSLENSFTIAGKTYKTGIIMQPSREDTFAAFNLEGKYDTLHYSVARIDGSDSDETIKLRVLVDGEEVQVVQVEKHSLPRIYDVEVSGAQQVLLKVDYAYGGADIALTEVQLLSGSADKEESAENSESPALAEGNAAVPADIRPYEEHNVTLLDNDFEGSYVRAGKTLNTGMFIESSREDSYAVFNVEGAYKTLSFTLGRVDGCLNDEVNKVRVFVDGEEKSVISVPHFALPADYSVDVTGAQQVRITVDYVYGGAVLAFDNVLFSAEEVQLPQEENAPASEMTEIPAALRPYEYNRVELLDNALDGGYSIAGEYSRTGVFMDCGGDDCYLQFDLGGAYSKLCFTAGRVDGCTNNEDVKLTIYADGEAFKQITVPHFALPAAYEVDVAGAHHLRIEAGYVYGGPVVALTNVVLLPEGKKLPEPKAELPAKESAVIPAEFTPYETNNCTLYENEFSGTMVSGGESWTGGFTLEAERDDSYLLLNTKGAYSKLHFRVGRTDGSSANDNTTVHIYLDGEEAKRITIPHFSLSQTHDIDISGVKMVRITVDYGYGLPPVAFTDVMLLPVGEEAPQLPTPEKLTAPAAVPADIAPFEYHHAEVLDNDLGVSHEINGERVNSGVFFEARRDDSYVQINLSGRADKLSFTAARFGEDDYDGELKVRVFLDGVEKQIVTLPAGTQPQSVEVDVAGVNHVMFTSDYAYANAEIAVYDISFS